VDGPCRDKAEISRFNLQTKQSSTPFTTLQPHTQINTHTSTQFKMADSNGSALKQDVTATATAVEGKGKGKAPADAQTHDEGMDVDESSSEEEVDEV
jgi:hypothetical protein